MLRQPLPATMGQLRVPESADSPQRTRSETIALIVLAVTIGVLLYLAGFSGSTQWILGVTSLTVFALFASILILRRTAEPAPLVGAAAPEATHGGEFESLAAAVKRASRGLVYSQVQVASRARAAFVERVRLGIGLSPEAMRDVQGDPVQLRRVVHDEVLEDFVRMRIGDLDERQRWVIESRERGSFVRAFRDVLARMEAWR